MDAQAELQSIHSAVRMLMEAERRAIYGQRGFAHRLKSDAEWEVVKWVEPRIITHAFTALDEWMHKHTAYEAVELVRHVLAQSSPAGAMPAESSLDANFIDEGLDHDADPPLGR